MLLTDPSVYNQLFRLCQELVFILLLIWSNILLQPKPDLYAHKKGDRRVSKNDMSWSHIIPSTIFDNVVNILTGLKLSLRNTSSIDMDIDRYRSWGQP